MNINNNLTHCGSRNEISKLPQAFYTLSSIQNALFQHPQAPYIPSEHPQASDTLCDRQTNFPNLHKHSTSIAADKTDSPNLRKHSTSIAVDKTDSANLHKHSTSTAADKTEFPIIYRQYFTVEAPTCFDSYDQPRLGGGRLFKHAPWMRPRKLISTLLPCSCKNN